MGRILGLSAVVTDHFLMGIYSLPIVLLGYCLYGFRLVRIITG